MNIKESVRRINPKNSCFSCYNDNVNWISELQDILEELQVNVEDFVIIAMLLMKDTYFYEKGGRLRVYNGARELCCLSSETLIGIIEECAKKIK